MKTREQFSTWFKGSESEWQALPISERDKISFASTGCSVAYPTWDAPVDCVHAKCQMLRGEIKPIVVINWAIRAERENWLRGVTDRRKLARIIRAIRNECVRQQTTDIWVAWPVIVYGGIQS